MRDPDFWFAVRRSAELFGSTEEAILSKTRQRPHVQARHAAVWALRMVLRHGVVGLGTDFGRDHSTITFSVAVVESWFDSGHPDALLASRLKHDLIRARVARYAAVRAHSVLKVISNDPSVLSCAYGDARGLTGAAA